MLSRFIGYMIDAKRKEKEISPFYKRTPYIDVYLFCIIDIETINSYCRNCVSGQTDEHFKYRVVSLLIT